MPESPMKFLAIATLFLAAVLFSGESEKSLFENAKRFEVRAVAAVPPWAQREDEPLFRVAWVSDLHIIDQASVERNRAAFAVIRNVIMPDAVFITGDNCGLPAGFPGLPMASTLGGQRLLWLKDFIAAELPALPVKVIPGDNWYHSFEKVFGPDKFSFNMRGFHFVFMSVDATGSIDGCSKVDKASLEWLQEDLRAHEKYPTIFVQHEPVMPPCYLNAGEVSAALDAAPQVVSALGGHLHLDLEYPNGHWKQLMAPSTGRSHRPAFKVLSFWRDIVVIQSYEWADENQTFRPVLKFQRIDLPETLRPAPDAVPYADCSARPAAPRRVEKTLDYEYEAFKRQLAPYLLKFGFNKFLRK